MYTNLPDTDPADLGQNQETFRISGSGPVLNIWPPDQWLEAETTKPHTYTLTAILNIIYTNTTKVHSSNIFTSTEAENQLT